MLTGHDIVCLSTQDWSGLWTRKQRFMRMFQETGNRVLYIETPVHLLGLDVLPADPWRFFRFLKGPRLIDNGLYVATLPILLPMFQMSHSINRLNHMFIRPLLRQWLRTLRFKTPLFWIYTPFSAPLLDGIENRGAVYECVDEFRAARGFVRAEVVGEMEDELLKKVNLTIVTQEKLLPHREAVCARTFCIPNGADVAQFRQAALGLLKVPEDIDRIPRPRLGFLGHIQYWIDFELIRFLAERKPEWSFVFVGPAGPLARKGLVKSLKNVHFLGRRPQQDVPPYVQGMDCCLNPYVTGPIAEHASPLKLYEYLAAGKPIVSTEMPEARKFEGVVRIAKSYDEYLDHCMAVIASLPEPRSAIEKRTDILAHHSWEIRFKELNAVLARFF